jgi:hypothetical protein
LEVVTSGQMGPITRDMAAAVASDPAENSLALQDEIPAIYQPKIVATRKALIRQLIRAAA